MPVVDDDQHDEPSNLPAQQQQGSSKKKRRRQQQKAETINTRTEARAMATDAELLDHLVMQGSYQRHHARRLQQQIDRYDAETMPRRERMANQRIADQINQDDDDDDDTPARRRRRQPLPPTRPQLCPVDMGHAGDAQAYRKKKTIHSASSVCDVWPRRPQRTTTNVRPDHDWDQLYGDGLAQRAIYDHRAGEATRKNAAESTAPLPSWEDEEDRTGIRMHTGENPFPDLIYKAWERAMHAASTVVTVPPPAQQTEAVAAIDEQEEQGEEPFSRDKAEEECKRFHFELDDTVYSTVAVSRCPSCEVKECSSIDELKNHYYGTDASKGCCWALIERHRETFVLQALERDAKNQIDQLLHLAFGAVNDLVQNNDDDDDDKPVVVDCFDLHSSLDDTWTHAVRCEEPDGRAPHLETLQVDARAPPLILNEAILDSLHRRITERYSRVPR